MSRASTAEEIRNDGFMYSENSVFKILICGNVDYYMKNQGVIEQTAFIAYKRNLPASLPLRDRVLCYDGKNSYIYNKHRCGGEKRGGGRGLLVFFGSILPVLIKFVFGNVHELCTKRCFRYMIQTTLHG